MNWMALSGQAGLAGSIPGNVERAHQRLGMAVPRFPWGRKHSLMYILDIQPQLQYLPDIYCQQLVSDNSKVALSEVVLGACWAELDLAGRKHDSCDNLSCSWLPHTYCTLSGKLPYVVQNMNIEYSSYVYFLLFIRMAINIPPNSGLFNNAHNFVAANCQFTEVMIIIYHKLW